MSKILYSSSVADLLYTYKIDNGVAIILDPKGNETFRGTNDVNVTAKDKKEWAINTVNDRNKSIIEKILNDKIKELDEVYVEAEVGNVTLSDGNVFNASKTRGENPNKSLNNTLDLIKKAVEFAIYFKQTTLVVSDAYNNDVEYEIKYVDNVGDPYIIPVVEIGMYMNLFFTLKRTILNDIQKICTLEMINTNQPIDVDALLAINPRELFIKGRLEKESFIRDRFNEPTEAS